MIALAHHQAEQLCVIAMYSCLVYVVAALLQMKDSKRGNIEQEVLGLAKQLGLGRELKRLTRELPTVALSHLIFLPSFCSSYHLRKRRSSCIDAVANGPRLPSASAECPKCVFVCARAHACVRAHACECPHVHAGAHVLGPFPSDPYMCTVVCAGV